jgi:hypothetical protein
MSFISYVLLFWVTSLLFQMGDKMDEEIFSARIARAKPGR